MKLTQAMAIATTVINKRPGFILCGSVALAYLGMIDRPLNDIDFCCFEDQFDPTGLSTYGDYGPFQGGDDFMTWKITTDCQTGFYYNVFVFKDKSKVIYKNVGGINVQSPMQIIAWKKEFKRQKDLDDLAKISEKYIL